jgi:hypothetical protein
MNKREMRRLRKRKALAVRNPDREKSDTEDIDERVAAVRSMLESYIGKELDEKFVKCFIVFSEEIRLSLFMQLLRILFYQGIPSGSLS